MSERFTRDNAIGKALADWWKGLEEDRASRAILRRAASPTEVVLSAPYQHLYRSLRAMGWNPDDKPWLDDKLATAVGLLVHVKTDSPGLTVPKAMGHNKAGEGSPAVSELRFLRLLDSRDLDGLYGSLRRVLPLMEHKVDVLLLTNDVLFWGDEVRKRWAYAYYERLASASA